MLLYALLFTAIVIFGIFGIIVFRIACPSKWKNNTDNIKFQPKVDCVIVGAGISGLTAGICLIRAGLSVAIFEKHDRIGGSSHSFQRKMATGNKEHWSWDTGVHCISNLHSLHKKISVLTNGTIHADIIDKGAVYDVVRFKDKEYRIPSGKKEYEDFLYKSFPLERTAIKNWLKLIKWGSKALNGYGKFLYIVQLMPRIFRWFLHPFLKKSLAFFFDALSMSVKDAIDSIHPSPELRALLTYQIGLVGSQPGPVSFGVFASAVSAFIYGSWYPRGGGDMIAKEMARHFKECGGKIFTNSEVKNIHIKHGEIQEVIVKGPRSFNAFQWSEHQTNRVIITANPRSFCETFSINDSYTQAPSSTSHCFGFFGLDSSASTLNLPSETIWSFDSLDMNKSMDFNMTEESPVIHSCFITCPTAKDSSRRSKYATVQMLCEVSTDEGQKALYGEEYVYKEVKNRVLDAMKKELYKQLPQTEGHLLYAELGTPTTSERFLNSSEGESYGSAHTCTRYNSKTEWVEPTCSIKGLYFAGQDILCAGILPTIDSGIMAAAAVLGRNVMNTIMSLVEV